MLGLNVQELLSQSFISAHHYYSFRHYGFVNVGVDLLMSGLKGILSVHPTTDLFKGLLQPLGHSFHLYHTGIDLFSLCAHISCIWYYFSFHFAQFLYQM